MTIKEFEEIEARCRNLLGLVKKGRLTTKIVSRVIQDLIDGEFEKDVIPKWIEEIARQESTTVSLTKFKKRLKRYGRKLVARWQTLGLEPHFLPKEIISVTPSSTWENWYSRQVEKGKILRLQSNKELLPVKKLKFGGIGVLIDIRARPFYQDGKQMFKNDNLLGPVIKELRQKREISQHKKVPRSSRFGALGKDWQDKIRPNLAKFLNVRTEQVRLETVPEKMAIFRLYSHLPRSEDGNKDTWEWCEEFFEDTSQRLCVGTSEQDVTCVMPESIDIPDVRTAFRPLIVL